METILTQFVEAQIKHIFSKKYGAEVYSITLDPFQADPETLIEGQAEIETLEHGIENVNFHFSIFGTMFCAELEVNLSDLINMEIDFI